MNLNKKLSFSLATFSVLSILASCSSGNLPSTASINGSSDFSKSGISSNVRVVSDNISKEHIIVDAGNGVKTNASITFNVNLGEGNGFKTKANVNGTAQGTFSQVASLQFWLIDSATTPVSTTGPAGSFTFATTFALSTSTHTVTFDNVPDNTVGNYYIAASAFKLATPSATSNITNLSGTVLDTTLGKAYISTSSVNVTGEQVVPLTALSIPVTLLDAVGAKIDGVTSITNGSALSGGVGASAL